MTVPRALSSGLDVAVFTRNHECYLSEACEIASISPARRIAFRAVTTWTSAAAALRERKPRDLYIAPIGTRGRVQYAAELYDVEVDPHEGDRRTKELLRLALDSTKEEGLWENSVGTLYVIEHCRKLRHPFPITELVKVSDGKPLSAEYRYSYSVVYPRPCD